jgi:hypothetical protein
MSSTDPAPFLGYWKITEMEVWALSYIDLVVPGFIEFTLEDENLIGSFQFGTVRGWLHCFVRDVNGTSTVEWSWEGGHDADPGSGRGWAILDGELLVGRIFIHGGDHSAFKARRQSQPPLRPGRVEKRSPTRMPQVH